MTNELWGQIREELLTTVGRNNYVNWIEPLEFSDLKDGVATFFVPTHFMGNWVARNFGDHIRQVLVKANQKVSRVAFLVPSEATTKVKVAAAATSGPSPAPVSVATASGRPAPAVQPTRDEADLPGAPLDPRFTFESFVVGKPNELAHAAARRVAETCDASFNPVFLYGGVGLGKTHLMHAIGRYLRDHRPEKRVLY